ncbi:MAG TPA: methyltransferase domain-containing protein [Bryobacteraceae bacterium]|nr:methyltransferase domain-containing protein [Bryobacteraceae bacterium]
MAENREATFTSKIQQQVEMLSRKAWYHSIDLPDGTVIPGLIPVDALQGRLNAFPIPADLSGKRVLDVGAATGWNSFALERRGAEVVAVDCVEYEEFLEARELLNSRVEYLVLDMEEMTPEALGYFDYVVFFGVLYHLRHPLLGLERVCALAREAAFVESFVTDATNGDIGAGGPCLLEFYETKELGGQIDNWFGPNVNCLMALCRSAGFARVQFEYVSDRRAGVTCYRKWASLPVDDTAPAPWINSAVNNRTGDVSFRPPKDEYINLYFQYPDRSLRMEDVRVEVDGYGLPLLDLADLGRRGWQANLRVPPGLAPGAHEVRLRAGAGPSSNAFPIYIHTRATPAEPQPEPRGEEQPAPEIFALENTRDGTCHFHGYKNEQLCCCFRTAEPGLTKETMLLEIDGIEQPILLLTHTGPNEWQTNSRLPKALPPGPHSARLRTRLSPFSREAGFHYEPDAS